MYPPAPREYTGNMCGVRIEGLPPITGGAADPRLVLSWFYDRYTPPDRARIRQSWASKGDRDVLLSWPDSRAVGATPDRFAATCQELREAGFRPCVMLYSKDVDPPDVGAILAGALPVLERLLPRRLAARIGVGWELSLRLSPFQVQQLIDFMAPPCAAAGVPLYVHFQEGYSSFQVAGGTFADFWNLQVGKLSGVFHQKKQAQDLDQYRYDSGGLTDILVRFAGHFGVVADSGFGHPFDCIALEITAIPQFAGTMPEAVGDWWGQWAVYTPTVSGPAGVVRVMGSGNGGNGILMGADRPDRRG